MPKATNIQFPKLIHEVFDSVITNYGFSIQDEEIWLQPETAIFARNGDIVLGFRLGSSRLFWNFSLEIELSGNLGEKATSDSDYRSLGVTAIAQCLDSSYKRNMKAAQTEEELREIMERQKEELLNYCEGILLEDVSKWQKVVDCLKEKGGKSG